MQTIFLLLIAITIGILAKKRGRNPWAWGGLTALAFLVIDTIVALMLLSAFKNSFNSDASVIYTFATEKIILFSVFVAVCNSYFKDDDKSLQESPNKKESIADETKLSD